MSRTPHTEAAYLRRALWFEERAAKILQVANPDPREVAVFAVEQKPTWAKSTWRQIKSALMYRYSEMDTETSREALRILTAERQTGCQEKTKRTSACRKKSVSDADVLAVIDQIRGSRSAYALPLERWIVLGSVVGLRPHEWVRAEVIMARRSVAEGQTLDADNAESPSPFLRVANAKDTNGRSHGEFRHIDLSLLPLDVRDDIAEFCGLMAEVDARGEYDRFYQGCRKLLFRITGRIKSASGLRLQIYSARHRFSSDAKRSLSMEEVAALMGHASDKTATRHYGRRQNSQSGVGIRPLVTEVSRVRKSATTITPDAFAPKPESQSPRKGRADTSSVEPPAR